MNLPFHRLGVEDVACIPGDVEVSRQDNGISGGTCRIEGAPEAAQPSQLLGVRRAVEILPVRDVCGEHPHTTHDARDEPSVFLWFRVNQSELYVIDRMPRDEGNAIVGPLTDPRCLVTKT